MNEIQEKIIAILTVIFDEYEGVIHQGLDKDSIEQWDSLASAQIIMAMEREFNKHFTDEEIASINSVGDILRLVGGAE